MKKLAICVAVGVALAAQPAWAMESDQFAGDVAEAKPVVSVRVDDSDPDDGVCTGTAIDPHWVITARHCVEAAAKAGGSVRTGQGDNQKVYKVDRHEVAPRGDIALLHTEEDMGLNKYASVADSVPDGDVTIYGWSSDGSGGSTRLPSAEAEVRGESPLALFDAPTALDVALKHGARIQPGDSGGAILAGGKVAGIMSAGLFEDPENPTEEEMTSNAAVAVAPVAEQVEWIRGVVAGSDVPGAGAAASSKPSASVRYAALGLSALALVAAALFMATRRKAGA
ncbi:trypsin-like serine protease [Corynebacterium sp. zg912]|uniref:Trypsin-like serine protease n=1 Tax=Corynebacterium wankanglinii TaxID=2735136 RepID=A0A7H0KBX0_9CORY|nr:MULTISPECIES: trypsin-like serine protease [Corynebacterium]MBA1837702.1 trypsin-like serine protease [Corynebacterium wankanglinii]MCR5928842.1 trypsin-like serine protease [Corynebacterium sp. zg912]QNP94786.1 trypsin-like serine protease [Corynebacterium wankanglinii]